MMNGDEPHPTKGTNPREEIEDHKMLDAAIHTFQGTGDGNGTDLVWPKTLRRLKFEE